ncbi:hypothetical protein RSOLAG22IIIB_05075 [Rhizoctonia solani]|uniref:Uncharacterized protein n=1 Tax=Rhizoctonia solani TaxID=456999 RepID=A0A0K6G314_9AGAM|nr:hypothetical protein RSOLAG22IIIB_05075 [Rhizoctonia solani]
MAQTPDGKWIQVRVGYQQAGSQLVPPQLAAAYGAGSRQSTEVPAAYANIVIDPDLGNRKRKAKKSKEVIEDEVDDTGEGPSVAGPSRLPSNAGKPSRVHLKVKGT